MTTAFGTDRSSDSDTIAAAVAAAAQAAAAAMPAELVLRAGETVADPESGPLPPTPGAAVTAGLTSSRRRSSTVKTGSGMGSSPSGT